MKSTHSTKAQTSRKKTEIENESPPDRSATPDTTDNPQGLWLWMRQHPGTSLVIGIGFGLSAVLGTFVGTQIYIQNQENLRDRATRENQNLLSWVTKFAKDERQGAILALGSLDNPEAQIQLLADLLGLETDAVRLDAIEQALVSSGPKALPYLQKLNQAMRTDLDSLRYSTNESERQAVALRLRSTQRAIAKILQLYSSSLARIELSRTHLGQITADPAQFTLVLEKTDLSGIQLRGAVLNNASFKGSQFFGPGGDRRFGTFDDKKADLTASQLTDADFTSAFLSQVILEQADLSRAKLDRANLSTAQLTGANLSSTQLIGAELRDANLSSATLTGANLGEANLSGVNLTNALLGQVSAVGANFTLATMTASDWQGADLAGADLSHANLQNANLSSTQLTGANFSGAQLQNVNFQQADLSSTNLQGANVAGADFQGAKFVVVQPKQSDRFINNAEDLSASGLLLGVDFTQAKNLDPKQIVYICAQGGLYPQCGQFGEEP